MRYMLVVIGLAVLASGCSNENPTGASQLPSTSSPAPPAFADRYTQISVGEVVSRRATTDDPVCEAWHCQYFRLTAPSDGLLEAIMTATGNLDASIGDSSGRTWWDPAPGARVRVLAPVKAGATYQITVIEYTPGAFELRTSMEPK